MPSFIDSEFDEIIVTRRKASTHIRIRVGTNGQLAASVPPYTPLTAVKYVVNTSRDQLRAMLASSSSGEYTDGQAIGKSHTLRVVPTSMVDHATVKVQRQVLLVYLPPQAHLNDKEVQHEIRATVITILRREAKAYLPRRLKYLADTYGFTYERVRFSHSSGRWGSCSSLGTISLNIALMKLPHEQIDYVLVHELSHTRHMNHSRAFWREVERCDPLYRVHRQAIKRESPSV